MPPEDLEARRWLRELFRTLGAQHPTLKTPEQQERLARSLSAEEELLRGVQAAMETYRHDCTGTVPPLHMREYMLVMALQRIAAGEVKIRETRAYAAQVLTMWQEQQSNEEDTTHGEER